MATIVHGPSHAGSARYLASHGRLLLGVTLTELRQRYAGSLLGLGWAFLAPLLVLVIYALIYVKIFRVQVENLTGTEYVLYLFCGLVPYLAAAESIAVGAGAVIANKSVLSNTVFPIDLTPVKAVLATQPVMFVGLGVVLAGAAATGNVHSTLVLLPGLWLLTVAWLIGLTWLLSVLVVIFRDLQNLITALLMVMLVASPIAYTPDMVPPSVKRQTERVRGV